MFESSNLKSKLNDHQEGESNDEEEGKIPYNFINGAKEMIILGPFNVLFLCIPVTFICNWYRAPHAVIFIFALLSIAPLAERLGFVTEQLAMHTNDTIGGLLNVTFGNATELIVAVFALKKGLYRVVQLTLLGSILSNILLVLGCAFLAGGLRYFSQKFSKIFSQSNIPLLLLACMSSAFPTTLIAQKDSVSVSGGLFVSRCASVVMLILYFLYIYFQLVSHRKLFDPSKKSDGDDLGGVHVPLLKPINEKHEGKDGEANEDDIEDNSKLRISSFAKLKTNNSNFIPPSLSKVNNTSVRSVRSERVMSNPRNPFFEKSEKPLTNPHSLGTFKRQSISLRSIRSIYNSDPKPLGPQQSLSHIRNSGGSSSSNRFSSLISRHTSNEPFDAEDDDGDEEEDEDVLGVTYAIFWLTIVTLLISVLSDLLVETIQPAAVSTGMSNVFLSAIVIPIIGNAAEHASAVIFGLKNKLDLSLAIAVGSATQIAAFLMPLIVIIGWIMNVPMSWNYQSYEVATLVLAVILVGYVVQTGASTWLDGVVLIGGYLIVSGTYWAHLSESDINE